MSRETVVLVHGIWMHGLVMRVLAKRLRDHGFATREFNYAFLRKSGSPVRGSDVARQMHAKKHWRPLLGRSVEEGLLGGGPVWRGQPPLGIINGRGAFGVSRILFRSGQDNDGVVAANETLADAATDAATVPQSHSTMLFSRRCADLCARFIDAGTFS